MQKAKGSKYLVPGEVRRWCRASNFGSVLPLHTNPMVSVSEQLIYQPNRYIGRFLALADISEGHHFTLIGASRKSLSRKNSCSSKNMHVTILK